MEASAFSIVAAQYRDAINSEAGTTRPYSSQKPSGFKTPSTNRAESCRQLSDPDSLFIRWRQQRRVIRGSIHETMNQTLLENDDVQLHSLLQTLCIELIDYISIGHFRVYQHNDESLPSDPRQLEAITGNWKIRQGIYRHIGESTDQILAFNERVESATAQQITATISDDLCKLYRSLSIRFVLEEQLLTLLQT